MNTVQRSEDDFAVLVRRYVELVYPTALRQVGDDVTFPQDGLQSLFGDLEMTGAMLDVTRSDRES